MGDFAAQAVVNTILGNAFPADEIVGEEDAKDLRVPEGADLRTRVVELARETLSAPLGLGEQEQWGLGSGKSHTEEELLSAIDRGTSQGGNTGRESFVQHASAPAQFFHRFLVS